jgi:predicted Ser/Thr protein kinase
VLFCFSHSLFFFCCCGDGVCETDGIFSSSDFEIKFETLKEPKVIAEGAEGMVLKAKLWKSPVAIKVLKDVNNIKQFQAEAKVYQYVCSFSFLCKDCEKSKFVLTQSNGM